MKRKISLVVLCALIGTSAMSQVSKKKSSKPAIESVDPKIMADLMKKMPTQKGSPASKTPTKAKLEGPVVLKNRLDSGSYAFGRSIGEDLKFRGLESVNYDLFARALSDVFSGSKTALSKEDSQQAINNLFASVGQSKNIMRIVEGLQFFEANKAKKGIVSLDSGLQYEIITEGTGPKPQPTDVVTVNYKGTLLNGTQFDSSYDRKEPLVTPLSNVIQGWKEGVPLMSVGSKYRFFIPYALAYGENGSGSGIPPYSGLIFEIELLKVGG